MASAKDCAAIRIAAIASKQAEQDNQITADITSNHNDQKQLSTSWGWIQCSLVPVGWSSRELPMVSTAAVPLTVITHFFTQTTTTTTTTTTTITTTSSLQPAFFPQFNFFFKKSDYFESEDLDTRISLRIKDKRAQTVTFKLSWCENSHRPFGRFSHTRQKRLLPVCPSSLSARPKTGTYFRRIK